ncbi:MAG: hypothetical protein ABEI86_12275, partial [Halobacteriaceae archaeon]
DDLSIISVAESEMKTGLSEEYHGSIYQVTLPDEIDIGRQSEEGTVAAEIADEGNTVAVTFDPECAEEYPSLRFLLPGDPIFEQLVNQVSSTTSEDAYEWVQLGYDYASEKSIVGDVPWIVGDLLDNGYGTILCEDGCIAGTPIDRDSLDEWARVFVQNRKEE